MLILNKIMDEVSFKYLPKLIFSKYLNLSCLQKLILFINLI